MRQLVGHTTLTLIPHREIPPNVGPVDQPISTQCGGQRVNGPTRGLAGPDLTLSETPALDGRGRYRARLPRAK